MSAPFDAQGIGVYSPKVRSFSIARKQVSQNSTGYLGLHTVDATGKPVDVTDLKLSIIGDPDFDGLTSPDPDIPPEGEKVADYAGAQVVREDAGTYHVEIGPKITGSRGNFTAVWTYHPSTAVDSPEVTYTDYFQVLEPMPQYEALRDDEKAIVERVSWMLGDLYDSTNGGPNLVEQFQTHFGYNRIAQLMALAIQNFNISYAPMTNYGVGFGATRLPNEFSGILTMGTYLEVVKHLIRSYVEQPDLRGTNVSMTDRRDYINRWKIVYDMEKADFDRNLKYAKRKLLSLGRGSLLVSGGIYGNGSSFFKSGTYVSQLRSMRMYPVSTAIVQAT